MPEVIDFKQLGSDLTHDALVGYGEVGLSFRWYSVVLGVCWHTKRPVGWGW